MAQDPPNHQRPGAIRIWFGELEACHQGAEASHKITVRSPRLLPRIWPHRNPQLARHRRRTTLHSIPGKSLTHSYTPPQHARPRCLLLYGTRPRAMYAVQILHDESRTQLAHGPEWTGALSRGVALGLKLDTGLDPIADDHPEVYTKVVTL